MTDVATTETEPVTETTEPSDGPKQLREALKTEKARTAKLTKQLMGQAYEDAGLDPEKGLGKAIAKEYKGDPTEEALLEYAKTEYDYEKPEAPDNPQAQTIADEQKKLDNVQTTSTSTAPLTDQDALQKASIDKDPVTAGRIKSDRLRALMKG